MILTRATMEFVGNTADWAAIRERAPHPQHLWREFDDALGGNAFDQEAIWAVHVTEPEVIRALIEGAEAAGVMVVGPNVL